MRKKPVKDFSHLSMAQLKRLKHEMDAKEAISRLNKNHHENIQRQMNNNILNEYSRIRNYLDSTMPVGMRDTHHLNKRLEEIKNMKII